MFCLWSTFLSSWHLVFGEVVAPPGKKNGCEPVGGEKNIPETSWKLQLITLWHPEARFEVSAVVYLGIFHCISNVSLGMVIICYNMLSSCDCKCLSYFHVFPNVVLSNSRPCSQWSHQSHTPPASARVRLGCCLLFHCLDPNANPHPSAVLGLFRGHGWRNIENSPVIRPPAPPKMVR